jgi:hypothetical protein
MINRVPRYLRRITARRERLIILGHYLASRVRLVGKTTITFGGRSDSAEKW